MNNTEELKRIEGSITGLSDLPETLYGAIAAQNMSDLLRIAKEQEETIARLEKQVADCKAFLKPLMYDDPRNPRGKR